MITVSIVDGQRDVREGFKMIIDLAEGFQCISTYFDGESAIKGMNSLPPDVVLIDVQLPKMSGIDCVKIIKRELPHINIIMLTGHTDDENIFQALRAGAHGYLSKTIFPSRLLNAIKEVKNGGAPMTPHIARRVVNSFNNSKTTLSDLSNREIEVLDLLCEGKNNREIAGELFISSNTVRFHLKNIYKKLQVHSKFEAIIKATQKGFFTAQAM